MHSIRRYKLYAITYIINIYRRHREHKLLQNQFPRKKRNKNYKIQLKILLLLFPTTDQKKQQQ